VKHALKKPDLAELLVRAHDTVAEFRRLRNKLRRTAAVSEHLRKQSAAMRDKLQAVGVETDQPRLKTPPSKQRPRAR